jgi:hypothetical protein
MDIFSASKTNRTPLPSPIEVWLSRTNAKITCTVVTDDERTSTLDVTALSMRGAQKEMTGYLISRGYSPVGGWEVEADSDDGSGGKDAVETSRTFKLTVFEFESAPVPAPGGPVNER